ncbi:MAG: hypothetical protein ABMA64_35220 [Myxococcota bacterium]
MNADWFETEVPVDGDAAATIALGMRRVARADGLIHQRELALIASFEANLPPDADGTRPLATDAVKVTFLRSLILVALADGVVSDAEHDEIRTLAEEHGLGAPDVERELVSVKRRFLSVFAGVNVFRDAVVRVARDLGLPESEVDALSQEA